MKVLIKYLFGQSPEKLGICTANYLWPVLTSRCCKNLKHLSHCKEPMYFCSHKMESTAGLFYVSVFSFRKSTAWNHVSVSISCMTFSISAEILHHYVPYVELVQSYFCTKYETEYSNMNEDASAGRALCHANLYWLLWDTCVYEFTTVYFS